MGVWRLYRSFNNRYGRANLLYQLLTYAFWQLPLRGLAATVRRRMQGEVGASRRSGQCISSTFPPSCSTGKLRDSSAKNCRKSIPQCIPSRVPTVMSAEACRMLNKRNNTIILRAILYRNVARGNGTELNVENVC